MSNLPACLCAATLTSQIANPVGVRVPRENDRVTDLVAVEIVENTVAIRTVTVPRILARGSVLSSRSTAARSTNDVDYEGILQWHRL